ncbi:MAG: helix-turn-helix transcriptional regulator [Planctomycetota bacterium]
MTQVSKIERILNLVSVLLKERRPVSWREIAGQVVGYDDGGDPKSLERRFERDKAALKELGIPIQFYPPGLYDSEGYMISREVCFLDSIEFMPHEASLLQALSELSLREGSKSPELWSALQKLRFDEQPGRESETSDPSAAELLSEEQTVLRLDTVNALRSTPQLDAITEATVSNKSIKFKYYAISTGETRVRNVDPYGLGFAGGAWYLVGRDHERDAIRQFKVARIKGKAECTAESSSFTPPEGFDVMTHLDASPWLRGEAEAREVSVHMSRAIAWLSQGPGSSRRVEPQPDGGAIVHFTVHEEAAFMRWLLCHGKHVRVIGPKDFKKRYLETIDALIDRHAVKEGAA